MEVNNLSYTYNKINYKSKKIFNDLNIRFKENINCIIGPNGCGKTTLLNIITGNISDYEGSIKTPKKKIGYVKDYPEFVTDTIIEELKYSMIENKYKMSEKRIFDSLIMVGLEKDVNTKIKELTDSERKLLQIACELIYNPSILVLDNPTEYLDNISKKNLSKLLLLLKKRYNKKIIIASNDINFIHKIADTVYVLCDGKIITSGPKYDVFKNDKLLKKYKIDIPDIIKFEKLTLYKKKIRLGYRDEINDLIKDIYRNTY
jgi:ABC-type multidrug transport system ATPase subunit